MFGQNTATNTGFSFGTTSTPTTATTFSFGTSQPAAASTTATTTNTLFGAAAPTLSSQPAASVPTSSVTAPIFGANTTTFGSTAPTSTATTISFGTNSNTTTSSLGTSAAPTFGTTFGTTANAANTNTAFGANNNANTAFGTNNNNANTAFGATSLGTFGAQNNTTTNNTTTTTSTTTQQQHFLDLQHCFPDTNMSSYIVKPESITRSTDLVNQLFGGNASRSFSQQQKASKSTSRESLTFNENPTVLPLFLSATDANHSLTANNKSSPNSLIGKKRLLEDKTLSGREKSHKGVFGQSNNITDGFNKNLKKLENSDHLPTYSVNDIGMNLSTYKEKDTRFGNVNVGNNESSMQESSDDLNSKTRVRVFGFDPSKTQEIITFFTKLGELTEPYASQGNWVTFRYVSPEAALKAISYNGMNIDKDHMVGVTWDEKAKEIRLLQPSDEPIDLFKKHGLFPHKPQKPEPQPQPHQEPGILNRLRDKLMGW